MTTVTMPLAILLYKYVDMSMYFGKKWIKSPIQPYEVKLLPGYLILQCKPLHTIRIAQLYGGEKYWRKVYRKGLVGKHLTNTILNKTICAYIINCDQIWKKPPLTHKDKYLV